jgi:hypothetical protein
MTPVSRETHPKATGSVPASVYCTRALIQSLVPSRIESRAEGDEKEGKGEGKQESTRLLREGSESGLVLLDEVCERPAKSSEAEEATLDFRECSSSTRSALLSTTERVQNRVKKTTRHLNNTSEHRQPSSLRLLDFSLLSPSPSSPSPSQCLPATSPVPSNAQ